MKHYAAHWSRMLWVISAAATVACLWVMWREATAGSHGTIHAIFYLPLVLVVGASFFMVRGYTVTPDAILVHRLGWSTRLPRAEVQSAEVRPDAMRHAIRLFANGGMFSFTGLYRTPALGNFRAFVTNTQDLVVMRCAKRTVVLSPAEPEMFVQSLALPR